MAVDRTTRLSIILFAFYVPAITKTINSSGFYDHLAWARRLFRGVGLLSMTTPGSSCGARWRSDIAPGDLRHLANHSLEDVPGQSSNI